jgi:uncharacterized protein (TIGR00255 family)
MTGFFRKAGRERTLGWVWEARTVNGRGLDLRLALAAGAEALDPVVRDRLRARLKRGNVQVSLALDTGQTSSTLSLDGRSLALYARAARLLVRSGGAQTIDAAALLSLKGVTRTAERTGTQDVLLDERVQAALLADFEALIDGLIAARALEGAALLALLSGLIDQIEQTVLEARTLAQDQAQMVGEKLQTRLESLLGERAEALDPQRLAQEVALLAQKSDVREELDRLEAHIANARALLSEGEGVGRKLDFLCQEFNREANTLGSKSASLGLTRAGLALKALIEQMREQVQNVE